MTDQNVRNFLIKKRSFFPLFNLLIYKEIFPD
jgi:hypothetical protein